MKPYAVVTFIHDENTIGGESASEVPSCWLTDDLKKCWWPNTKNVAPHILKKTTPDKVNSKKWQLHDICFEGFFDNITTARHKADGLSSGDETADDVPTKNPQKQSQYLNTLTPINEECSKVKLRKKNVKLIQQKDNYSASDDSDDPENGNKTIPSPPTLKTISHSNEVSTNSVGVPQINKSIPISIHDDRKSTPKIISNIPITTNFIQKKDKLKFDQFKETSSKENNENETFNESSINGISLPLDGSMRNYIIDKESISLQIEGLTILTNEMYQKIAFKIGELTLTIKNMTERLEGIERIININQLPVSTHDDNADLAALFPLQTVEQIIEFEAHILIADVQPRLVSYFVQIGGNSAKECIIRILNKVFDPAAVKGCSWCGQRGNYKVNSLNLISAIKDAVRRSYACTDKFFEDIAKEWFRQGTQKHARIQKKKNLVDGNVENQ